MKILHRIPIVLLILLVGRSQAVAAGDPQPSPAADIDAAAAAIGRGINLGNALEAPREGDWGVVLKADYFREIKQAGFDSVRLPVRWSAHAGASEPYTIDPDFFARVDWAIEQAVANDLVIVVNVHHFQEMYADPDRQLPRLVAIWRQVAERYRDQPESVYFELLNEPNDRLTEARWNEALIELLEVIRPSHPTRPVIVGPGRWNNLGSLDRLELPASDRHLIVTFHYYEPFQFTHQGAGWVDGSSAWRGTRWESTEAQQLEIEEAFDRAVEWSRTHDRPLYLGEFGAFSQADMESRTRWTRFVVDQASRRGISWSYWEFCSGFGAFDPQAETWRYPLLESLMGPDPP